MNKKLETLSRKKIIVQAWLFDILYWGNAATMPTGTKYGEILAKTVEEYKKEYNKWVKKI